MSSRRKDNIKHRNKSRRREGLTCNEYMEKNRKRK